MRRNADQCRWREPADPRDKGHRACARCSDFSRAFSLVEMMIAIIILGLGLVMVATIFPVAWDRARTLSEYTVEQSAAAGAQTTLATLLRPASHTLVEILPRPDLNSGNPREELRLTSGSLAGDMFFDPTLPGSLPADEQYLAILAFADTSVHALNVENMLAKPDKTLPENPLGLVAENSWNLEDPEDIVQKQFVNTNYPGLDPEPENQRNRGKAFPNQLFYGYDDDLRDYVHPQVHLWQRLYPPMEAPPTVAGPELDQWNEKLATRRFCWAALHRLRSQFGPKPLASGVTPSPALSDEWVRQAAAAMGSTRTFDVYYVTLRRPKSTNRYARQNPDPALIPNPFSFVRPVQAVSPAALPSDLDVMFPVAWRVQIQFLPGSLALAANSTGIPTEVQFPPNQITDGDTARMLVQMFPAGTQFVDEITGNIYRVSKRRITDPGGVGTQAVLTLDREVVLEDVDIAPLPDPRCEFCTSIDPTAPAADPEELLRTVWVFPPPVDRSQSGDPQTKTPQFDGPSPVVDIEVAALSISPSS